MTPLVVCPECQRHLRRSETSCPFCDADLREAFSQMLPRAIPTERLGRSALLAFAAANLGVAACGGEVETPQPVYGAPAYTGGTAGSNTGGTSSGTGGSRVTGGAPGTGGYNTGGVIILPPYGIAPIPPEPPSAGGNTGTGGAPNTSAGGATSTGGDMGVPIYGAAPPKP